MALRKENTVTLKASKSQFNLFYFSVGVNGPQNNFFTLQNMSYNNLSLNKCVKDFPYLPFN